MKSVARYILDHLPEQFRSFIRKQLAEYHARQMMSALYREGRTVEPGTDLVLFWIPGGMPGMLHVEGAIAAALRLRGSKVHAVICDGAFRACVRRTIQDGVPVSQWQQACHQCQAQTSIMLKTMGIPYSFIGDHVPFRIRKKLWDQTASVTWDTLDALSYDETSVGKNARSAIFRYLKGQELKGDEEIVREYAYSALVCAAASTNAIKRFSPSRIFMSHCIYVDWGPALQVAIARQLPVFAWKASYLTGRFFFKHVQDNVRISFHALSSAGWDVCKHADLSPKQIARLDGFWDSRYKKHESFDMKQLKQYHGRIEQLEQKYALQSTMPVWGILAHINWDSVSDYAPMAYFSLDEWMLDTLREITNIPTVQWLVKVHPAEMWHHSARGVHALIEKYFPSLPSHVRVISAEEEINPLEFFELIDGGVTVYGTSGLELALQGKPVILAGEAHYGGKGFTHDGWSRNTYRQLLRQASLLKPLSEEQKLLARKYAYCYFIQRQIPLPVVKDPQSAWWKFQYHQRHLLLPGKEPFMDMVCDRILDGQDFIMDEDLVTFAENGT